MNPTDALTDAINRALDEIGDQKDEFVAAAARRILEKTEWCESAPPQVLGEEVKPQ